LTFGAFKWEKIRFKEQISYAGLIFLSINIGQLIGQIDQQLIINFLGPEQAGIYGTYFTTLMVYGVIT